MDEFEENKKRLEYQQKIIFSNVLVTREDLNSNIKQQYQSKLIGKFDSSCYERNIGQFREDHFEEEVADLDTVGVEVRRGCEKIQLQGKEAKGVDLDVCIGCHNVLVCGINMRVRISYEGKTKRERKKRVKSNDCDKRRSLIMTCLCCGTEIIVNDVLERRGLKRRRSDRLLPLNTLPLGGSFNVKEPVPVKKAKKRKRNASGLSALLERKQAQESQRSSGFGLEDLFK